MRPAPLQEPEARPGAVASTKRRRLLGLRAIDVLVLTNLCVFLVLCAARYLPRFIAYRGAANLHEFFLYAAALLLAAVVVWLAVRRRPDLEWRILALVQLGLLMHWLGAFVAVDGGRLYDVVLLPGLRYDKLVHFVNGAVALAFVVRATPLARARLGSPFFEVTAVAVVLGLATMVELIEYAVMKTVPNAGAGGYDDTMQDLAAGLAGSLVAAAVLRRWWWPRRAGGA